VVSALPRYLAEKVRVNPTERSDMLLNSVFQLSPEISINLTKMKNRLLSAPHKQRTNGTEG